MQFENSGYHAISRKSFGVPPSGDTAIEPVSEWNFLKSQCIFDHSVVVENQIINTLIAKRFSRPNWPVDCLYELPMGFNGYGLIDNFSDGTFDLFDGGA